MPRARAKTNRIDALGLHVSEALLSDAPSTAVAAIAGVSPSRIRQRRAALGVTATTGRPRKPDSRDALAALGRRVLAAAAARSLSPDEFMDAAERAVPTTKGTKR